ASSYNVKRSTTSGGPYTTITNVTSTSFVNIGLANGTTYYYVVSALNSSGESGNSAQASATPVGTLPAPLVGQDIGSVGVPGSSSYSGGTYTLTASGTDIYSTNDAFQFVYRAWTGDVEVVTRVVTQENTHTW